MERPRVTHRCCDVSWGSRGDLFEPGVGRVGQRQSAQLARGEDSEQPLRVAAWRDRISALSKRERVHRSLAPLARLASLDLDTARADHADAHARKRCHEPIEDMGREPSWTLVVLGHNTSLTTLQHLVLREHLILRAC